MLAPPTWTAPVPDRPQSWPATRYEAPTVALVPTLVVGEESGVGLPGRSARSAPARGGGETVPVAPDEVRAAADNLVWRRPDSEAVWALRTFRFRKARVPWPVLVAGEREAALRKWMHLADVAGPSNSTLARELLRGSEAEQERLLETTFHGKSSGTLQKRAGSMLMFLRWARPLAIEPFPLHEPVVYNYLEELRRLHAPPTRANAFREAIPVTADLLGLAWPYEILHSRRCTGSADLQLDAKPPTKQAPALTVAAVRTLEEAAVHMPTPAAKFKAGACLFLLHSRSRASDGSRISSEPWLDLRGQQGFLEATALARHTKTGQSKKRRCLALPVVCIAEWGLQPSLGGGVDEGPI